MYFVFIDSSGSPSKPSSTKSYDLVYVLSAFIVHETALDKTEDDIIKILQELGISVNAEIHASSIVHPKEHYRSLPIETRKALLDKIYDYIAKIDCTIISVLIYKTPVKNLTKKDYLTKLLDIAYELLIERLAKFFDKIGTQERILIIIDESSYRGDYAVRSLVKNKITSGFYVIRTQASRLFFRVPLFYDSKDLRALQLVDAISYAIFKKHTNPISNILNFNEYYNKILPKFDKCSATNEIEGCGLKLWTFIG